MKSTSAGGLQEGCSCKGGGAQRTGLKAAWPEGDRVMRLQLQLQAVQWAASAAASATTIQQWQHAVPRFSRARAGAATRASARKAREARTKRAMVVRLVQTRDLTNMVFEQRNQSITEPCPHFRIWWW